MTGDLILCFMTSFCASSDVLIRGKTSMPCCLRVRLTVLLAFSEYR